MRGYKCHLSIKISAVYQLSVRFSAICQLSVKILAICQLSINHIQTLVQLGGGGVEKSTAVGEGARGTLSCHHRHIFIVFLAFFFRLKHAMTQNFSQGLFNKQGSWEQGWLSHLFSKVTME